MNKSLMTGVGIGVVVAAAAGAVASFSMKGPSHPTAAIEQASPLEDSAPRGDAAKPMAEPAALASADVEHSTRAASAPSARVATTRAPASASSRGPSGGSAAPSFARVVAATPVVEAERVAREVCHDEQVVRQKPVQDEKRVAGAALGAIVGGVLGNQVGDGDGQKIATAAGAIAGGVAGSKIQKRMQQGNTETVTEKRCQTVYDTKEKTVGWDVRYRIGDQVQTTRMDSNPGVGAQLPLRDGRLTAQTGAKGRGTT